MLRLNRAETYLRLEWYYSALCDVEAVLQQGPITDEKLNRKAAFREMKANYGLERYVRVVEIAKDHQDGDIKSWAAKARKRIAEQTSGNYDWFNLFKDTEASSSRPDVANYVGPVEVKDREESPGVRGVFTTRDVKVGELLVSNCFS